LRGAEGAVLDQATRGSLYRACFRLHRLLGATVTAFRVDPPRSFTLSFSGGLSLTVFDDSTGYESCSIQPGNIII
jgi:hypothetical protein